MWLWDWRQPPACRRKTWKVVKMRKKARPEIQQIPENLSDFWCATSSDTSSDGDAKGISISIFLENTTELDWMLVSMFFKFSPRSLRRWSNLTYILKRAWNHQLVKALKMIKCSKKLCPVCSLCYSNGLKQPTRWSLWDTKQIKFLLWKHAKTAERPVFEGPFYPFFCGLVQRKNKNPKKCDVF